MTTGLTPEEKKSFRHLLRTLEGFVLADGRVDYRETTSLLGLLRPFASLDPDCAELAAALEAVNADGVVTDDESKRIIALIAAISARGNENGLIYGIEDKPPFFEALFAALQHLLAIFVGIITPPIIICSALGTSGEVKAFMVSMALFASGVCTFVQCRRLGPVGAKLLCVQGTSFQFISPLIAIGLFAQGKTYGQPEQVLWGLPLIFGCCIAAAPAEMVAAFLFRRLRKVITPLVSGIVVTLIGLGLVKVGIISCCGGFGAMGRPDTDPLAFASWRNLTVAAVVLLTIAFFNSFRNKFVRMGSVVLGLLVGYLAAWNFGMLHFAFGSSLINVPVPFKWGVHFDLGSIVGLAVVYFITSIEANGDITANSLISGLSIKDDSYHARVRGGVLADGVNSALAGCFNSFPNSIFAQNNGLIQLTGVASRHVGYYIAGLLVLLGLFPVVGDLFGTMPDPVLGGATLLMFGMVAAAGVRIIATQPIGRKDTLVLALAFGLGLGVELCPQVTVNGNGVPWILKFAPDMVRNIFSSGLVTGGVVAILANALIRIREDGVDLRKANAS